MSEHCSLLWPFDEAVSGLTIMVRGSKPGSNISYKLNTFRYFVHFCLSRSFWLRERCQLCENSWCKFNRIQHAFFKLDNEYGEHGAFKFLLVISYSYNSSNNFITLLLILEMLSLSRINYW